jgi:hypothetical protein
MISLKLLLEEVERELDADLEESKTGEEAKRLGLDYMSFGRYGKDGKVTHKSQGGKLVPVKGTGAKTGKPSGRTSAAPAARKAPAKAAPAQPEKSNLRQSLTPKNVNTKLDTKAVRKTLTTRYQGMLRANNIDVIEERPGMVLIGDPEGFMAIGQRADGQWAMRAVDYIDKKTGEPKFYEDSDFVDVAPSFPALMKKSFGVGPSRTPKKPAPRDNYRMSSSDRFRG